MGFQKVNGIRRFVLEPHEMETTVGPSLTVPEDSMSIKEIMQRHIRGMQIKSELRRPGGFADTEDFDALDLEEVNRMDIFDRETVKQKLADDIAAKQKILADHAKKSKLQSQESDSQKTPSTSKKVKIRGDARLGGNPPDDLPRRPTHAVGRNDDEGGMTEDDTQGVTAGE